MFFEDLLKEYSKIKFPEQYSEVSKVDKAISWYLADTANQFITVSRNQNINIVELDIKQAFTTICRCLFEPDNEFIIQMNQIEDKKSRNIYIATSLVNTEYLRLLNIISKVVVIGSLFEIGDITLLELKKDGATVSCDDITLSKLININETSDNRDFNKLLHKNNFIFHVTEHEKYIRSNRTSYFWDGKELIIKGTYKHIPLKLIALQKQLIQDGSYDQKEILKIYSRSYFEICKVNHLNEILNNYYICGNKRYLAADGKYVVKLIDNIDPRNYLKTFLYPIILSSKL